MAYNKECLVIVLDVRRNSNAELKRQSVKCVTDILKEKICASKKDFVSFVLFGTQRTHNAVSVGKGMVNGLPNIVQYPDVVVPSWDVLVDFMKFVAQPPCNEGVWLDALVVALELLKNSSEICKIKRARMLLFHDFDAPNIDYSNFETLVDDLAQWEAQLVVVSRNIRYIDNVETGDPQAVFATSEQKPDFQLKNEKYALRLVSDCSAKLLNFREALHSIMFVANKQPSCWNSTLTIGSQICIQVSCMLAIKDDSTIKLKKCWGEVEEIVKNEYKYFVKDEEVQPSEDELIEGYMLGATPVPFDEPLKLAEEPIPAGLKFVGFVKRDAVPTEYYCSAGLHWVVHQKGKKASARMMDALVQALLKRRMCIICWKIYSLKLNNPKFVVLVPNKMEDDRPASMAMFEVAYHVQHTFWDFPRLRTKKNGCTKEQLDAIDNLIDSMDLLPTNSKGPQQVPRQTLRSDLLPFDTLPNIFEKYLLEMLERKVLCAIGRDDSYIQDILPEKNFEECYWRVPEAIEQQAKTAALKVKELFPLDTRFARKESQAVVKKVQNAKERHMESEKSIEESMTLNKENMRKLECVGFNTPANDFEKLLKREVLTLQDNTLRDAKFHFYAAEMRVIISKLLFQPPTGNREVEKIIEALKVFRKCCIDFNAFADYNKWMQELKEKVVKEKLFDFWSSHVVKERVGLCFIGQPSLEEKLEEEAFYEICENDSTAEQSSMDTTIA